MQLRQYQTDISTAASELLKKHNIAYLNMQVRTGKTITAFETVKKYVAKIVIFVTKKKAMSSVEKDYLDNYANDFKCYLINFESLHKLAGIQADLFIIDEAHSLGQFPVASLRTQQLKKLCHKLPIIYLSGTPSPESYSQLFHQFWVSSYSPFAHVNFYKWVKLGYVTVKNIYVYNRTVPDYSTADKDMIDEKIQHLFLSYTQEEAGFIQAVEEKIHIVKMSDKLNNIIRILRRDKVITGASGDVIEADTEVKLLNKLHQLSSGTCLFDNVTTGADSICFDNSKADYLFVKFKGQKMAIFYKFKAEYTLLCIEAQMRGLKFTSDPDEFNATDENTIFLSQFLSGREGINLSKADCLICYNIDFSAITYWQVRARLQTKDRTEPALVHWLFSENGVEQRVYNAVKNKKNYTLSYFKKDEKSMDRTGTEVNH